MFFSRFPALRWSSLFVAFLIPILLIACKTETPPDSSDSTYNQTSENPDTPHTFPEYSGILLNGWSPDPDQNLDKAPELISGRNTLSVRNSEDNGTLRVTLSFSEPVTPEFGEKGKTISLNLAKGEETDLSFTAESGVLESIRIARDQQDTLCVYTLSALRASLDAGEDCVICPCVNLSIEEELTLTKPIRIRLTASKLEFSRLLFKIVGAGTVEIVENQAGLLSCKELLADAPDCDFLLPNSLTDVIAAPSYYLRAKSLNRQSIVPGERLILSADQLDRLLDADRLPDLRQGDTLRFSGAFTVSKELSFDIPLNFIFEKGFTLENPITLSTDLECNISILDSDSTLPTFPVLIHAPQCDLTWESCTLSMPEIGDNLTIRSLNGRNIEDVILGGNGKSKLKQVVFLQAENQNLSESFVWKPDADSYILKVQISCVLDPALLKKVKLTATADNGGTVTFDNAAPTGTVDLTDPLGTYLTVTDQNGEILRYVILTEYVPTRLPVVIIQTKTGANITSRDEYVDAVISINSEYAQGDLPSLDETPIQIRGRGNSTWEMPKKPYKIKFTYKTGILGMEKAKEWTLLSNYIDYSLIRNSVALDAAAFLSGMPFSVHQYPVDVFVNGEYAGVYSIGEQIEVKSGRVELTDNGTEVDTGYLLEVGGTTSEDKWDVTCFQTELMKYVKVRTNDTSTLTKEQVAFIKDYVKKADAAVMAGEGYEEYIDMDSLIDWFILHELSYNVDSSFRRSCFLTKDAGGKLKMGPAWDFDLAFGMFNRCPRDGKGWACLYESNDDYLWTNWMTYLLKDQKFIDLLQKRWNEIKDELLETMLNSIDSYGKLVAPSAEYNFKVWNILGVKNRFHPTYVTKYSTYQSQLDFFKEYLQLRWNWIDQNIKVVE